MLLQIERKLTEFDAMRPFKATSSKKKCLESKRFIVDGHTYRLIRFSKRVWIAETDGSHAPNFIDKKNDQKKLLSALEKGDFKFSYF